MNNLIRNEYSRSILKLGIPIMIGQLGVILVSFIDNIMVGHYGTNELAAASFVNGVMSLAFVVAMGYTYGLTPLVSGAFARKDGKLKTLLISGIIASAIGGVVLMVVMGMLLLNIHLLGQPQELLPYIRPYYTIQLLSLLPVIVFNAYKQFVDGVGRTQISMMAVIASNVVNIVFNYLLIYGSWGFPELGLVGAGLATFISRLVCLAILIFEVHFTHRFKSIFMQTGSLVGVVSKKVMQQITGIGMPSAIQMGFEAGAFSIAVVLVGWLGRVPLAAHQIAAVASTLGFMMFYGLSAAVTIMVGRHYELKQANEIRKTVKAGMQLQLVVVVFVMALLLAVKNFLGRLFTSDPEVISLVSLLVFPLITYQVFDMLQILFSNTLRGMHDVKYTAWSAAFCYLILTTGIAYLFGFIFNWGVVGVWFAFPIGFATLAALLICRYHRLIRSM